MRKSTEQFNIGIIGCGYIGNKRAKSINGKGKLIACSDIDANKGRSFAKNYKVKFINSWQKLIKLKEIDIVIVSTLHDSLASITLSAIKHKKHVLVEKPAARSVSEIKKVINILKQSNSKVRVGFNHRYHPAILKAKKLIESGELGELMFLRARYGHGGRLNYEKEWRANPKLSGGGELIDQGSHLIDLSRFFLGDFSEVHGFAHTFFWNMSVDDNSFMTLKTKKNKLAFLHASCTEWKNLFSFEIYGKIGKIEISGLGGSYGIETIIHYRMLPEMGPPKEMKLVYPSIDKSWEDEINEFYNDIELDRQPAPGIIDAFENLKIIDKVYKQSGYNFDL
jgi:predicted dehydrogenase